MSSKVLVLCPHTDDEMTCAGYVLQLAAEIHYIAFSSCEESLLPGWTTTQLEMECLGCMVKLGLEAKNVSIGPFRVRHFTAARQEILEHMILARTRIEPNLVLCPSSWDTHQDHKVIREEAFRAFKTCKVLGYEMPQNETGFAGTFFVTLTEKQLKHKLGALKTYQSQRVKGKYYDTEKVLESLARVRGAQCGVKYAECFEVIRWIV